MRFKLEFRVAKHVNPDTITEAKVSRVDREFLLNRGPDKGTRYEGETVSIIAEQLLILDGKGESLASVGGFRIEVIDNRAKKAAAPRWKRFWMDSETEKYVQNPLTIEEALEGLRERGVLDQAVFVLSFIKDLYYLWDDPICKRIGHLVLYKPPKDFTLPGWLEEEERREREQIQQTIDTIDAEATAPVS